MITCELENGKKTSFRHVVVRALVLNTENKVLLVRRAPHLIRGGKFDIPGGFMDRDETTEQGVLRELREETGVQGKIKLLFRINDSPKRPKEDRQNVDFIYIVEMIGGELKTDSESTEVGWFSQKDLPSEEEFAFDHLDSILKYFQYLKEARQLPIIG